jgi:putative ABC transport system permease protein
LSYEFFRSHFGENPNALGQTLVLNDIGYIIVGVLPVNFHLPASRGGSQQRKPALWVPYDPSDEANPTEFYRRKMQTYARLADGVTIEQARAELNAIMATLAQENPTQDTGYSASVFPVYVEDIGQDMRRNLLILLGAVGFVLLIACANIANLMLSRAAVRQREMAIRKALGAGRGRLVSQLLIENLLLSAIGAALGLFVASAMIRVFIALKPADINRPEDIHLSVAALVFTALIATVTAILFGIMPALQAARSEAKSALRPGAGTRATPPGLRYMLIIAEVALASVLLVGATFMMQSLNAVRAVDPGFRADHLLTMRFSMPASRYANNDAIAAFCRQALEKISVLPGVKNASFSDGLPLTRIRMMRFTVEGQPEPKPGSEPTADMRGIASAEYFDTIGLRLVEGRNFAADELAKKTPVVVVNQALARHLWPNESAIGKHLRSLPSSSAPQPAVSTIIGVVADTHQTSLEDATRTEVTKPMVDYTNLTLAVRTDAEPTAMVAAVKSAIWSLDRYLPVFDVQTMQHVIDDTTSQRRFNSLVMAAFAGLALLLAAVGIYGVLSSIVSQRTAEIGIRMALGAQTGDVLRMVIGQGVRVITIGLILGLAGGWAVARLLQSVLFGVDTHYLLTYAGVALAMMALGTLACFLPARRASRVNPVEALRYE